MKLELKHLAPYLPYGLKVKIINYPFEHERTLSFDCGHDFYLLLQMGSVKPILRPLSDLFKSKHLLNKADDFCIEMIEQNKIECLPYGYIQLLFENHFDAFGLIEKGLAIDINKC